MQDYSSGYIELKLKERASGLDRTAKLLSKDVAKVA